MSSSREFLESMPGDLPGGMGAEIDALVRSRAAQAAAAARAGTALADPEWASLAITCLVGRIMRRRLAEADDRVNHIFVNRVATDEQRARLFRLVAARPSMETELYRELADTAIRGRGD